MKYVPLLAALLLLSSQSSIATTFPTEADMAGISSACSAGKSVSASAVASVNAAISSWRNASAQAKVEAAKQDLAAALAKVKDDANLAPNYKIYVDCIENLVKQFLDKSSNDERKPQRIKGDSSEHGRTQRTEDAYIDEVEAELSRLKKSHPTDEAAVAAALAPLFSRPAFYNSNYDDWNYFFYAVARTRLVLQEHIPDFRQHPSMKDELYAAAMVLTDLQDVVAKLYGPAFSASDYIDHYIDDRKAFLAGLHMVSSPGPEVFATRNAELDKLKLHLCAAGIAQGCATTPSSFN